jgi:hypothetical protein
VLVKDSTNLFGDPESFTATLDSPAGADFDLFAYEGDAANPDCFAAPLQATGTPEALSDQWPDGSFSTDDRWITLEVRHISGPPCTPSAKWTLTVAGHTQ